MKFSNKSKGIIIRYSLILLISLFYPIFNTILAIPTIGASYFIISLFHPASILGNILSFNGIQIELIDACIAGLAYLLLIVLNLAVEMPLKTRIKALSSSILVFWVFNVFRITKLALMFSSGSEMFSYLHAFFWYFGSIILVFLIWLITIKIFKIKENPIISDIKFLIKTI